MGPAGDRFTHFVRVDTPCRASGPTQARPPETVLEAGARVRLLGQAGGRALVEAEDGTRGYVASDALACDATPRPCGRATLP